MRANSFDTLPFMLTRVHNSIATCQHQSRQQQSQQQLQTV